MIKRHSNLSSWIIFLLGCFLMISAISCNKEVMGKRKMEQLMYDIYVAEATFESDYQNFNTADKKEAYIQQIFKRHGVSEAQWDSSLSYYSDRIDTYIKMNDSVKARIKRAQDQIEIEIAEVPKTRHQTNRRVFDSDYVPEMFNFASEPEQSFTFVVDSMQLANKTWDNEFKFGFDVMGLPTENLPKIRTMLMLEYNDTTIYRYLTIRENKSYTLSARMRLPDDTLKLLYGYVKQFATPTEAKGQLYNIYLGEKRERVVLTDSINTNELEPIEMEERKVE